MKSQVSFKFDGQHNKEIIISILKSRLENFKYKIEYEGSHIYRIYVGSSESKEKTMIVCKGIQCYAVYDFNREL